MSKMLEVTSYSLFKQNKIPLTSFNGPECKDLGFEIFFKEIVLQPLRILGLTHRRASPVLSHLANFIH